MHDIKPQKWPQQSLQCTEQSTSIGWQNAYTGDKRYTSSAVVQITLFLFWPYCFGVGVGWGGGRANCPLSSLFLFFNLIPLLQSAFPGNLDTGVQAGPDQAVKLQYSSLIRLCIYIICMHLTLSKYFAFICRDLDRGF